MTDKIGFAEATKRIIETVQLCPDIMIWLQEWTEANRYVCSHCGKAKVKNSFYQIRKNKVYTTGRLPLCKKCVNKLFDYYALKYCDYYKAMEKICQLFDLAYDYRLFRSVVQSGKKINVGMYLQKLNLRQNKFKNSFEQSYFGKKNNY